MQRRKTLATALAGCLLAALGVAAPAHAVATLTLADWEMNEPAGATTMVDSGPHHLNGVVGSGLSTGTAFAGATGYSWSSVDPTAPPTKPQRLVNVNSSLLDPGTADYAVTIRYRSTHNYGNILQKGQNGGTGYWKFEQPNGIVSCLFQGSSGQRAVKSPRALNDGAWHVVTCSRTANALTMSVDGAVVRTLAGATGNISNTLPLTIGGKGKCDQVKTTCDYFAGSLDYVKIQKG